MALRNNPNLRILLLERGHFAGPKAGETLPPQCRILFERLGIWEAFLAEGHLPAFGSKSAWGDGHVASQEFMTTVQRNGWHLDRERFDAFMAQQAVLAGVEILLDTSMRNCRRAAGGWELEVHGHPESISCKLLVDATGRSASVARQAGADLLRFDHLTGTMAVFEGSSILDRDTLVEACPRGWWYSALLPGQKMACAFFTDASIAAELRIHQLEGWKAMLAQAPLSAQRILPLLHVQTPELKAWPAQSQRLSMPIGLDWIAVGDAAAAFDPLSSQGIFFALRSALMAAFACADLLAGGEEAENAVQKYRGSQAEQFVGYWEVRRDFYQMEQRWATEPFWKSRHGAIVLGPSTHVRIVPGTARARFFSRRDLQVLVSQYPDGAPAYAWVRCMAALRPDLPAGHALEGLQSLVEDGHAISTQPIPRL